MKFLIIQTAFPGDVILATPLIEKLHHFFPESKIDFLLRKGNEPLLENHPKLNEIIVWDKRKNKFSHLISILLKIRKNKYGLVINLQRFASSGILTAFSGANNKIGFDKNPFSFLFTKKIRHEIGNGKHETERNLLLIEHFTDKTFFPPRLYPAEKDFQAVAELKKSKYICIAPASVWFTKQFPKHKWVELINKIPGDYSIYMAGGKNDAGLAEEIIKDSINKKVFNLCGKLSFLQTAALMKDAGMNFVNDSAPLHIASAMNAPVTAIFCSTIPAFGFRPLSEKSVIIETKEILSCRPCGLHGKNACPEGHFKCAEKISVNDIPV